MVMVEGRIKGRGRPKLNVEAVVQNDLGLLEIMDHDFLERAQKRKTHLCSRPQLIET